MNKHLIAAPLAILAVLGMTSCTAVAVSEHPQATVTIEPQGENGSGVLNLEGGSESSENSPTATPPSSSEEEVKPDEKPSTSKLDLGASKDAGTTDSKTPEKSTAKGTRYLKANQAFSPSLSVWDVDGEKVSYKEYNCLAKVVAQGSGVLAPTGWDDGSQELAWGPESLNVEMVETYLVVAEDTLTPSAGMEQAASTNKSWHAEQFTSMCAETGDTVVDIVF